jgi:hypothetical protein
MPHDWRRVPDRDWKRAFDDPIPLPDALLLVAERGGPTMLARIGIMRALNRHVERMFDRRAKSIIGVSASSRAPDDTRYLRRDLPTVVPSRESPPPLIGPGMPMQVVVPSVS